MTTLTRLCAISCLLALATPLNANVINGQPVLDSLVSDTFELTSRNTGSTYLISVALPADYRSDGPEHTYPVIYVLDGQWLFPTASWVAQGGVFDVSMPPAIVIGITWKESHDEMMAHRGRDFAPFALRVMPGSGHATEFRHFLSEELIPAIGKKYRAGPTRALVGLSLGGLFTIDTLVRDPDLFDIYVADSPSLMYDDGSLRKRFDSLPANFLHKPTRLYLTWGGAEALVDDVRSYSRKFEERHFKDLRFHGGPVGHVGHSISSVEAIAEGLVFGFARDAIPMSAGQAKEYVGRYASADGSMVIQIKSKKRALTIDFSDYGAPANNVPLKLVGDDNLIAEANFVELWFKRDARGQIVGAQAVIEGTPALLKKSDGDLYGRKP